MSIGQDMPHYAAVLRLYASPELHGAVADKYSSSYVYQENDYIFKHADGSLYYPDYPSKAFRKIIKKLPEWPQGITFHGLRSSCVSILVHQGMDVKSIQKWVGHRDLDTTLRIYAKVKEKEAKKVRTRDEKIGAT